VPGADCRSLARPPHSAPRRWLPSRPRSPPQSLSNPSAPAAISNDRSSSRLSIPRNPPIAATIAETPGSAKLSAQPEYPFRSRNGKVDSWWDELETLQKTVRAGNPLPYRHSARGTKTNASDARFCLVALERSQGKHRLCCFRTTSGIDSTANFLPAVDGTNNGENHGWARIEPYNQHQTSWECVKEFECDFFSFLLA